ncbi:PRTRC system protein B [Mucilaginibacter polytrichastri]|nr:PRTRC system protein B [Mucilaginibacter polytrichastri]SFS61738.1 PRTRC system protein B [Mucilaginibacter polytrichastri]
MKNITETFGALYHPVKAFVVFQKDSPENDTYVECYDMDENGFPINAHPLSIRESTQLANALDTSDELKRNFLKPSGLMPKNVLYINPDHNGYAIWHTPKQKVDLFFVEGLGIPNGKAAIPPLLWKASRGTLQVYALEGDSNITTDTPLYHAPFFNLYENGRVCMGTVKIKIPADCLLEEFIHLWQQYFFNSFFSHTLGGRIRVNGNVIQLWQSLVGTKKQFPINFLQENGLTLKKILS